MNHQPFEKWIFSDETLHPDQQHALENHLQTCEGCRKATTALAEFELEVRRQSPPLPAVGFTQRWKNRLLQVQRRQQQQRLWIFTLSLFALANIIVLALLVINQSQFNVFYAFGHFIANFSQFAGRINQVWKLSLSIIKSVPVLIPVFVVFGVGTISAMAVLIVTWFSSMIQLYQPVKEGV